MNAIVAIDNARAEVAALKVRCRQSYDRGQGLDMAHLLLASFDYHRECTALRQAEERLRLLELRLEIANDTAPTDVFESNYPRPRKPGELLEALAQAMAPIDFQRLKVEALYSWDPKGEVFFGVARWAQVERAHWAHANREPTPGMTLPERQQMPLALAQALAAPVKTKAKRKRAREAS